MFLLSFGDDKTETQLSLMKQAHKLEHNPAWHSSST